MSSRGRTILYGRHEYLTPEWITRHTIEIARIAETDQDAARKAWIDLWRTTLSELERGNCEDAKLCAYVALRAEEAANGTWKPDAEHLKLYANMPLTAPVEAPGPPNKPGRRRSP